MAAYLSKPPPRNIVGRPAVAADAEMNHLTHVCRPSREPPFPAAARHIIEVRDFPLRQDSCLLKVETVPPICPPRRSFVTVANQHHQILERHRLTRQAFSAFLAAQPPALFLFEACGGAEVELG